MELCGTGHKHERKYPSVVLYGNVNNNLVTAASLTAKMSPSL